MIDSILHKRSFRWLLVLLSGLLMVVSFPRTGSLFPLTFVAWVPLLLVEQYATTHRKPAGVLFFQAYLAFLVYNTGTTWWIYFADETGAVMAFFANSLLMALAFLSFHLLHRKLGSKWRSLLLLSTWISFEFLHFHWELSWPWLTFGNVMATLPSLVQWYSITGVLGGSVWILGINLCVLNYLQSADSSLRKKRRISGSVLLLAPIVISILLYATKNTQGIPYEVVILQPNVDPYNEKFNASDALQLDELLTQADQTVSPETQLVIAPETALYPNYNLNEDDFSRESYFSVIEERMKKWHHAAFLIGASTYEAYDVAPSSAAHFDEHFGAFMERYNSSVLFTENRMPQVVHKSKLVLGVEKIPFNNWFPSLEKLAINLGGGSGSLGIEKAPKILEAKKVAFSPAVCYESIYGGFMAQQAFLGSEFIAIITNDGWWDDTPGYRQHFDFASLRAIENNRWVARSANTGKSGIINNRGDVLKETHWWKKEQFRFTIQRIRSKTIYQMTGDVLGYFALGGWILFSMGACWKWVRRKQQRTE